MNIDFPERVTSAICLDKLFRIKGDDKRLLSDRMSSRIVRCASVLSEGGFIGWQMIVPTKGLISMSVFGTEEVSASDLEWITEKTAKTVKQKALGAEAKDKSELYELYLPIAEGISNESTIGFEAAGAQEKDGFSKWPDYYSLQFMEMMGVLQQTGAAMRIVVGPASEKEQRACRKNTLKTYDLGNVNAKDYIGKPVKIRVLLRLPSSPSVRLRTVVEEAVRGVKIRFIGKMESKAASEMWDDPINGAAVLPDYAARIMLLEPEVYDPMVGVRICEEELKKIPVSHKNTKDKKAILIGKATDETGVRRNISISEIDLRRHYQIVGQTGTGKSTLLATIILSAIEQGHGLTFFDPHGSTIDIILKTIPKKYANRVRVVRIGDAENPVPLNIWDSDDPVKEERNISDLCELFGDLFNPPGEVFVGPRYERWLSTFAKASIAFLGSRASLESIAVISQSKDNMLKVSKAIGHRYPELVETIKQEYGLDNSNDFHNVLGWYLSKFQRFISVEQLRKTLGAGTNALDFLHTIDTDTVTLIDLSSPTIGTHAARIVGTLLLMKLWNAVLVRKERDKTHLVVVDEAALFQTNPMPKMLAESRKFGLAMVLCHQHTGQLSTNIRDALEANSANFSAFRLSPKDAVMAAIRFDKAEMQTSLTRLNAFNAITTLSIDGKQTAPFTLETIRPVFQKDGEKIAKSIEEKSIETLVEPYRGLSALTSAEILFLLNHPPKIHMDNSASEEKEIEDAPEPDLDVGDRVKHEKFGAGVVTAIEWDGSDYCVKVAFASGTRKLKAKYAKLQVIE
ncbi:MAG: DUF87 domain-containing protein [Lachnospiraceae bacterium]|nr:DUF87 domain-containing protein [Lachnospiraceae bacterium]